jgi:hypothetical protein
MPDEKSKEEIKSAAQQFDEDMHELVGGVRGIAVTTKRNRKFMRWLALTFIFDVLLTLGVGYNAHQNCNSINTNTHALEGVLNAVVDNAKNAYQRTELGTNQQSITLAKQALTGTEAFVTVVEHGLPHPNCSLPNL